MRRWPPSRDPNNRRNQGPGCAAHAYTFLSLLPFLSSDITFMKLVSELTCLERVQEISHSSLKGGRTKPDMRFVEVSGFARL